MFYGKSPFALRSLANWGMGGKGRDQGEIVSQPNRQKTGLELRYIYVEKKRKRLSRGFFCPCARVQKIAGGGKEDCVCLRA